MAGMPRFIFPASVIAIKFDIPYVERNFEDRFRTATVTLKFNHFDASALIVATNCLNLSVHGSQIS